jgi:hypothetical protein
MKPFVVSLGFWLVIGIFVALGYALSEDCGGVDCANFQPAFVPYGSATPSHDRAASPVSAPERSDFSDQARSYVSDQASYLSEQTRSDDSDQSRGENPYQSSVRSRCAGTQFFTSTGPGLPPTPDWQGGSPVTTPALVLSFNSKESPRLGICPHVIGIVH